MIQVSKPLPGIMGYCTILNLSCQYGFYHTCSVGYMYRLLYRQFQLVLKRDRSILADDFAAYGVDQYHNKHQLDIDHEFYSGFEACMCYYFLFISGNI